MNELTMILGFFLVVAGVTCNSLNNDKIALERANEKLHEQQIKIESQNDSLKDSIITCNSELKGYANGSK